MNEYKDCYVAFLDLLGFKNILKSKTCEEILAIHENIKKYIKCIKVNGKDLGDLNKLGFKVMSDSICYWVDVNERNAMLMLIAECALLQKHLMSMDEPVLLRGAIAKGKLYAEGDKMFGTGLSEAYLMEDKCAKVPRIIILKDTYFEGIEKCEDNAMNALSNVIFEDFDAYLSIDCFRIRSNNGDEDAISNIKNHIEKVLSCEKDSSVREKYLYLRNRFKEINDETN